MKTPSSSEMPSYIQSLLKKATTQVSSLQKAVILFAASHYKEFRAQSYTGHLSPDILSEIDELSGHVQAHPSPAKPKRAVSSTTSPYLNKPKTGSSSSKKAVPPSKLEEYEIQSEVLFQEPSERDFRKDLSDLWEERASSGDFCLILGEPDGPVERVHSCILAARS